MSLKNNDGQACDQHSSHTLIDKPSKVLKDDLGLPVDHASNGKMVCENSCHDKICKEISELTITAVDDADFHSLIKSPNDQQRSKHKIQNEWLQSIKACKSYSSANPINSNGEFQQPGNSIKNESNSTPFFLKKVDVAEELLKYGSSCGSHRSEDSVNILPNNKRKSCGFSHSSTEFDSSHINVVVRVRPIVLAEKQREDRSVIDFPGKGGLWIETGFGQTKSFMFNTVFDGKSNQKTVFESCGIKDLIDKALQGYACTAFAFGATGSGKTFTMSGPTVSTLDCGSWGLVPRSFQYMFDKIKRTPEVNYVVKASFLEVYNEKVKDLLNPSKTRDSLPMRWSSKRGFYVDNLFTLECYNVNDLMSVLHEGSQLRQVGQHLLNDHSSRSHSMLVVQLDSQEPEDDIGFPVIRHGKISFVDLAGSERVKDTKSTGESLIESNNINKSLLTLGNCISALGDPKKRGSHIPYRESKLTKLLADTLGGDGYTLMIACVSPTLHVVHDTMNTLRYANRAKNIKNKPVVKLDPKEELLVRFKKEIKMLRAENGYFREQLGVPCSESQVILTPNQIDGELTSDDYGTLSPAIGTQTFSSLDSSRINSLNQTSSNSTPRAATALFALGAKDGLYGMLREFMNENEELKTENMQLHRTRAQAQRERKDLFHENERLTKKLDDLGRVMLSTPLSREHVQSWMASSHESHKTQEHTRFPPIQKTSYGKNMAAVDLSGEFEMETRRLAKKRENLREENKKLKRIDGLEDKKTFFKQIKKSKKKLTTAEKATGYAAKFALRQVMLPKTKFSRTKATSYGGFGANEGVVNVYQNENDRLHGELESLNGQIQAEVARNGTERK